MSDSPVTLISGQSGARVLITCEHASERLPPGWVWPEKDRRLLGSHWASDVGARLFAEELAGALRATAVLSNFSRLLIDPNRPLDADTLFRAEADGKPVHLNADINDVERKERIRRFYAPYHAAVDQAVAATEVEFLLSVHSFTDNYEGSRRAVEIGTLFDRQDDAALAFNERMRKARFDARLNEPWSGKEGLAYSVERHADVHDRKALEIEVRQDLAVVPEVRARIVQAIVSFFAEYRLS